MRTHICSNPKCNKEISSNNVKYLFLDKEIQHYACSEACYQYAIYIHMHGKTVNGAEKYLATLHPTWIKMMNSFLDDWEVEIINAKATTYKANLISNRTKQVEIEIEKYGWNFERMKLKLGSTQNNFYGIKIMKWKLFIGSVHNSIQ